ncbi:hypothetical protein MMC30_007310 [Trapelia coarctata]|nr:hypothetical protein [Trapelia coarctata]
MSFLFDSSMNIGRMSSSPQRNSTSTAQDFIQLPANLLEASIPGYSIIFSLLSEVFGFDITLLVSISFLIFALIRSVDFLRIQFLELLTRFGTCSVSMDSTIDCYFWIVHWLADQGIGKDSASLIAVPGSRAKQWRDNSVDIDMSRDPITPTPIVRNTKTPVRGDCSSGIATGRNALRAPLIFFDIASGKVEAGLYCLSCSTAPIEALIEEAADHYRMKSAAQTSIRRPAPKKQRQGGMSAWVKVAARPSRGLETVVLDEGEKERVRADMEEYLEPGTRGWYAARGIPYRRGYIIHFSRLIFFTLLQISLPLSTVLRYEPPNAPKLFHGSSSGTGKTSLSFALAGVFGLDVYCVSLQEPSITEEALFVLFDELPRQCLLLLEDIDSAGLAKRHLPPTVPNHFPDPMSSTDSPPSDAGEDSTDRPARSSRISLSTLLSAIDGIASHEGRGGPEGLFVGMFSTPAPTTTTAAYGNGNDDGIGGPQGEVTRVGEGQVENVDGKMNERHGEALLLLKGESDIRALAKAFAAQIPEKMFSAAEIQGFLMARKNRAADAVEEVGQWAVERAKKGGEQGGLEKG